MSRRLAWQKGQTMKGNEAASQIHDMQLSYLSLSRLYIALRTSQPDQV
jgi:hypothetical protein